LLGNLNELELEIDQYDYTFASSIYNLGVKEETQVEFIEDFKILLKKNKGGL
jgi:hypothetical protein